MPNPAVATAAASIGQGVLQYKSAGKAGEAEAAAAERSAQIRKQMYDEAVGRSQTQLTAGDAATNRLMEFLGIGGNAGAQGYGQFGGGFTMEKFKEDPFYQFSLGEGIKDLERTAAARGGLLSGSTIRGYKNVQGNEYQKAFDRYFANRANTLAPYQTMSGQGVNVLGQLASMGGTTGAGMGNAYTQGGEAKASQYLTQGNVLSNALNRGSEWYGQNPDPSKWFKTG